MAKTWYPVVDYLTCEECGTCVEKCPHGVYDTAKAPSPVVTHPDACIDHCHGCGNRCPVGAITYVGDNTGWTPPNGSQESEESSCSCGSDGACTKHAIIEFLYLDLKSCERCIGTDSALEEVLSTLTPALHLAGYKVQYTKVNLETEELARRHQILTSPTIRVNGQDIFQTVSENTCGCCSDISGTEVDCRVFEYNGKNYEVPPKEMLAEAILRVIFGKPQSAHPIGHYELPDNLKSFYEGKMKSSACSCKGSCC